MKFSSSQAPRSFAWTSHSHHSRHSPSRKASRGVKKPKPREEERRRETRKRSATSAGNNTRDERRTWHEGTREEARGHRGLFEQRGLSSKISLCGDVSSELATLHRPSRLRTPRGQSANQIKRKSTLEDFLWCPTWKKDEEGVLWGEILRILCACTLRTQIPSNGFSSQVHTRCGEEELLQPKTLRSQIAREVL